MRSCLTLRCTRVYVWPVNDLLIQLKASLGPGYRIDRELGGGGMSQVFLAEELALGRNVVVKVLPSEFAADSGAERFLRETRVVASLQHPNIVPVITAGGDANLLWFTMPFIEGESMRARLDREGELPIADAVRQWTEILDALAYAHARGIVHRDIKPENVLLSGRHALVADFGIARALSSVVSGARVTATGVSIGTPAYMSPEQAVGESNVDARADIYSAALVMYEMLCGVSPFNERSAARLMVAHATQAVPSIRERRTQVSAELEALVLRCLEKRPADRPQTTDEVLRALANVPDAHAGYTSGERTQSRTVAKSPGRRLSRRWVIAAVAVVAIVGGAFGVNAWRARAAMSMIVPDTARVGVMLMPPIFEPADSLLVKGAVEMLDARLKGDRRVAFLDMAVAARVPGIDERLYVGSFSRDSLLRWLPDIGMHSHVTLSLARAGSGYLLGVTARSLAPDSVLYARQLSAASVTELPKITETLVGETAEALGRAFGRIRRPLADGAFMQIGPDAARALYEGNDLADRRQYTEAAEKYRSVLRADSTLPAAALSLYFALSNAGLGTDERLRAIALGYRHRGRNPVESGRRTIETEYVRATGDWERALAMYEAQQREGQAAAGNNYGILLANLRRLDDALAVYARSRDTTSQMLGIVDANYVQTLLDLGRDADAEVAISRMERAQSTTHPIVMSARLWQGRASRSADTIIAVAKAQFPNAPSVSLRLTLLSTQRYAQLSRGDIALADQAQRQRMRLLEESGLDAEILSSAMGHVADKATLLGDTPELRREFAAVYSRAAFDALPPMDRPWGSAISGLTRLGRLEEARAISVQADAQIPEEFRRVFQVTLASARLELALAEGNGQRALAQARLRDRGSCIACAYPAYARAWDAAGNADSALFYYDRFLDAKSSRLTDTDAAQRASSTFRSAELREQRGNIAGALQRYREFVELRRNASEALQPRVREAQARIERLEARRG